MTYLLRLHLGSFMRQLRSMSSTCIVLTCGLPASGKSSFCQRLCRGGQADPLGRVRSVDENALYAFNRNGLCVAHICFDELLPKELEQKLISTSADSLCPGEDVGDKPSQESKWKTYRHLILSCIASFIERHSVASSNGSGSNVPEHNTEDWKRISATLERSLVNVPGLKEEQTLVYVIDDNMYYRSMRYNYYQLARQYEFGFCQLYFPCSSAVALQRNQNRQSKVLDDIIIAMEQKLEPPCPERYSWEKHSIVMETTTPESEVFELVRRAMADPAQSIPMENLEQKEESRLICSKSTIHQTDQILRRLVSEWIKGAKDCQPDIDLKAYAKLLHSVKTSILEDVKEGRVPLPSNIAVSKAAQDKTHPLYTFVLHLFEQRTSVSSGT